MNVGVFIPSRQMVSSAFVHRWLLLVMLLWPLASQVKADSKGSESPRKRVLVHFMPWFEADPAAKSWGWHWTMNAFNPNDEVNGRRKIASHFYPIIGPYDSGDPHVLECQLLQMKLAGADGVIIDWYGLSNFRDYPILHRNTERLVEQVARLGMQFAICYEDQTINALVDAGRVKADQRVAHATAEFEWLREHWFHLKSYVRIDDRPVLLSFGQSGLTDEEWSRCLSGLKAPVSYFSEHHRRSAAVGAFDWPLPQEGVDAIERFAKSQQEWAHAISVAFPRFVDIYAEAKVHNSHGKIEDNDGQTFHKTLTKALTSKAKLVQIATWNDWGEGTVIEPSVEYGYRDLETLQDLRRKHVDAEFAAKPSDLKIPAAILSQRRSAPEKSKQLDAIVKQIVSGQLNEARSSFGDLKSGK